MKKYSKKYWVLRWLFLAGYLAAAGVLIFESTLPREASAKRSDAVGQVVGGLINDMNGDQTKEVLPESVSFKEVPLEYKVGEEVALEVITEPKEATYRSYRYTSNNEEVGTVSETGVVSFIAAGEVTITATNTKVAEINTSITFTVSNIEVESMTTTLNATKEDDVYLLEQNHSYLIKNVIEPSNATIKTVTYEYDTNEYFDLIDDTIKVLEDSGEQVFSIFVNCGTIRNKLKIKTFAPTPVVEDYPITGLKASNVTKYTDQTSVFTPSVSYVPTYTSTKYKGYTLVSDNESVVKVQTNKTSLKPTGTAGTANITATSTYDSSIQATFKVTIQNRPAISSIRLGSYPSVMYVGASQTVSVSVTPSAAKVTKTFTSSNTSAVTVTNAGKLTAKALGTSTITAKVTDSYNNVKTASFTVEVIEKPINSASSFTVDYKQGENPIVYAEQAINLDRYFGIAEFQGNSSPLNKNNFEYVFDIDEEIGTYSSHTFTSHIVGEINGQMIFTNEDGSEISQDIKFTVMDNYSVYDGDAVLTSPYKLNVYDTNIFTIKDHSIDGQSYKIVNNSKNYIKCEYAENSLTITSLQTGTGSITITPIIKQEGLEDKELSDYATTITFNIVDVITSKMDISLTHKDGHEVDNYEETILLYMDDTLTVNYLLDEGTTKSRMSIYLSNSCATVRNGVITPKKVGNVTLTVKETVSGIEKEYHIAIRQKVGLKEGGAFVLSGNAEYDAETNTISIMNGESATISVNFTNDTTYRKVAYVVDNEKICNVGTDGTITPLKMGKTKVTVTVEDENTKYIEFELNIEVIRRDYIQDMSQFFAKIRKALGHFGAFAILGLLGAITWFLWFRGKYMFPVGVVANFGIGFGLAYLTEYIQRFVPGRTSTWSDVWLDFSGFSILAGITTLVIFIWWLTRFIITKVKAKKQNKEGE